jgi:5-methylthioribose kinase
LPIAIPADYRSLAERDIPEYLSNYPALCRCLGGSPADWRVQEVGDGNLNLVFIVEGPAGSLCVKQALPYVRLVGEGWPLPLDRAFFEHRASEINARHAQAQMPAMHHYDPALYLMAMERLAPHIIMRRGMIQGIVYPQFAGQIADYLARTLFFTSDLALPAAEKKALVATFCGNTALCRITEDLIFTEPYMVHERNHWTTPQLDRAAAAIRGDAALKRAVSFLKLKFLTEAQALLHGDMHTGSIMVTATETKVIDPEFAFFGPIGFDVGKLIGNLLLSFFSQAGHEAAPGGRDAYRAWILETVEAVWNGFADGFVRLWAGHPGGDAFPRALFEGPEGEASFALAQSRLMRDILTDSLGFAGASMIRRTLGLAQNIDMTTIKDQDRKAGCERLNLELARELILGAAAIPSIEAVTARARALLGRGPLWPEGTS